MWRFLKKLKIELPYNPAIALVGIDPKDTKMQIWRGTCTPMFLAALSTIAKLWKEPKCLSSDEWIKKMWYIDFVYNGILLSHQKEWNFAICNNVNGTREYYTKWNKLVKGRQIYDFTQTWNVRNKRDDHRGRKRKIKREANHKRLLTIKKKLRVDGEKVGEGWTK